MSSKPGFAGGFRRAVRILTQLLLVVAVGYGGWYGYQRWQESGEEENGLGQIPTGIAEVRDITVTVSATGVLQPVRIVQVKSKAAGEIMRMPVELGDVVSRGDLIAQIDTETLIQELQQAEADLESAQTRLSIAERQLERAGELHAQDLVSENDLESAQQNFATSRAQLLRAEADVNLRQERLDDATVQAPVSGTVIRKEVEEGQIITSSVSNVSGGTTLVEIADLAELQIRTLVDEIDIGRVKPGLAVESTVEAYPEREFRGTVIKIEPQAVIEQQVTTFPVLSRIDNTEGLLLPGMNADVDVIIHSRPRVLTVPNEAVREISDAATIAELLGIEFDRAALATAPTPGAGPELGAGPGRGPDRGAGAGLVPAANAATDESPAGARTSVANGSDQGNEPRPGTGGAGGGQGAGGPGRTGGHPGGTGSAGMEGMRERMQNATPEERARMREAFMRMRQEREAAQQADAWGVESRPEAAVVFVISEDGVMAPRSVMAGVRDWEYTEIAGGLRPGEQVVLLPSTSLLMSQQALRERFSRRMGVPGTGGRR